MAGFRWLYLAMVLSALLASCSSQMSLTEYVDRLNDMEARASAQARAIGSAVGSDGDLTPAELQSILMQAGQIREEVQDTADALEPPDQVADLHRSIFEWHRHFMSTEDALAARVGRTPDTDEGWTELSDSHEMAAYRSAIAEGKVICDEFQDDLDATADRGAFDDVPWLPGQMSEVVEAVLGCDWFPDDPESVYRWPPPGG